MRSSVISCTLLCLMLLAGCEKAEDGSGSSVGVISLFDPIAANPSLCGGPAIPFPNNALFSGTTDATLNIPNASAAPFVTAANLTDGFSTTASIFTDVLGAVDFDTAADAILIFEADASPRFLVAGTDFTVQPSTAEAQVSGTGSATNAACSSTGIRAKFLPISQQRSRMLIEPLKPLNPSTTYIVAVTKGLKSRDGLTASESEFFRIVNSDTKLCDVDNTDANAALLDCTNPAAPAAAAAASSEVVLKTLFFSPATAPQLTTQITQLVTLETLRKRLIRPTVLGLKGGYSALKGSTLNDSDLVIAWSFTTESVGLTLSRLNTSTSALAIANTTLSTGDLGLADTADIYAGTLDVPYYLDNSGGSPNSTAPMTTMWASTATLNAVNPPALGGAVPCGVLAQSVSTTLCHPDPTVKTTEKIPVLVTVPNANSGQVKPTAGWPVVIFQHGITRNRTDMLAIAPTLAAAGFVTIAIDMPLHGVTNNSANLATNPFYRNQIFSNPAFGGVYNALMTGERTFDLDLAANAPVANPAIPDPTNPCVAANSLPDGIIDSSGANFINLPSLITARDNLRQAEADIMHLARSMSALDLGGGASDVNEAAIRFAGQSLGSIVGTTVLGTVDGTLIQAASLSVPGGGLGKLLDASAAFGPRVSGGLSCSYVFEGTDTYETFNRFAQHLVDPADPINYAVAANANHALHVTEVIGDAVVPNSAGSTCPPADNLPFGVGATATFVDPAGTPAPASASAAIAGVKVSGAAGAALVAQCPNLVIPAAAPLGAITYQNKTVITGYLSGTDPLVRVMGITNIKMMGSAPFATQTATSGDTVVEFSPTTAEHGTMLSPGASSNATQPNATFAAATCAMQKQTATFLATNGASLPLGGSCP